MLLRLAIGSLLLLGLGACSERPLRSGHLSDVVKPAIWITDLNPYPGRPPEWWIGVTNRDAQGGCLRLGDDVEIAVDDQRVEILGHGQWEQPGKQLFAEATCAGLGGRIRTPASPRAEDVVIVRDSTRTLRATFAPFLFAPHILGKPPGRARAGERLQVELSRPPNLPFSSAFIPGAQQGGPRQVFNLRHDLDGGSVTLMLPASLGPQVGQIFMTEVGTLRARACDVDGGCIAELKNSFGWPLEVVR